MFVTVGDVELDFLSNHCGIETETSHQFLEAVGELFIEPLWN